MSPLYISGHVWLGIITTFHILALSMGSFRLLQRCRTKRYYWDDMLVLCCLICDATLFVVVWMQEREIIGKELRETGSAWHWLLQVCLPSTVWSSRLSIAFSVLRIIKYDLWRRRLMIIIIIMFVLAWAAVVISSLVVYENMTSTHVKLHPPTRSQNVVGIVSFVVYFIADGFLISIPLHLLRNLRLPRSSRLMVRVVFSSLGFSTVTGFIHDGISLYHGPDRRVTRLTAILKAPVALMVCSLIVVIPCIYRLFRRDDDWGMEFISIHIDESAAGPEMPTANNGVTLPERAAIRAPAFRSFSTLPFRFARAILARQLEVQSCSWPQHVRIHDESDIGGAKV